MERTRKNSTGIKFLFFVFTLLLGLFHIACEKEPLTNAVITGTVSAFGTPVSSGKVDLFSRKDNHSTSIDAKGQYSFKALALGDYTLSATVSTTVTTVGTINAQINTAGEHLVVNIPTSLQPVGGGGGGSCPYVYSYNGESYVFNGDIYAGAIYPSLERDDFTPLTGLKTINGDYKIKIANELQERQYTNLAELMVISHPENVNILFDKNGTVHTVSQPQSPVFALSPGGTDYKKALERCDNRSFLFNETEKRDPNLFEQVVDYFHPQSGKSSLVLTFDKKTSSDQAKLLIKAKNSNWSVALWHEFTSLFGDYYNEWHQEQKEKSRNELLQWRRDEAVAILVSVETKNGWEYVDCFNIVGSVMSRDMVLPLDLSQIKGDFLKIKLESAFMFWELDYAAIDYSKNSPYSVQIISPSGTQDKDQKLCAKVKTVDDQYLQHLNYGDVDELHFQREKTSTFGSTSIFLHSRGYYEQKFESTAAPQYLKLLGFLRPGSFAQYSRDRFLELAGSSLFATH